MRSWLITFNVTLGIDGTVSNIQQTPLYYTVEKNKELFCEMLVHDIVKRMFVPKQLLSVILLIYR